MDTRSFSKDNLELIVKVINFVTNHIALKENDLSIARIGLSNEELKKLGIGASTLLSTLRTINSITRVFRIANDMPNFTKLGLKGEVEFQFYKEQQPSLLEILKIIESNTLSPSIDWELKFNDDGSKANLIFKKDIIFEFNNTWSDEFKIFKYIWYYKDIKISYDDLYTKALKLDYLRNSKKWKINQNTRKKIRNIKEKLQDKGVSGLNIEINKGVTLSIKASTV